LRSVPRGDSARQRVVGGCGRRGVKIPYVPGKAKVPQPSLAGGLLRYRPIMAVRISGPGGSWVLDGLLDPGSDGTIFPEWIAPMIGLDLAAAVGHDVALAGRAKPLRCRYIQATLRITDGKQETYEWEAVVGFVAVPLKCPLLGQAGFLQFFDVTFRGDDHIAELNANTAFSGSRI